MNTSIVLMLLLVIAFIVAFFKSNYIKEIKRLEEENSALSLYKQIQDTEGHIAQILADANKEAKGLRDEADKELKNARQQAKEITQRAEDEFARARAHALDIVKTAKEEAGEIAGEALEAKGKAGLYEAAAAAMKNIIEGYGNEYVIPSQSLLDDLADLYGYTQAGDDLKKARARSKDIVKRFMAGECDYSQESRRVTAINFVVDAFNGKADSILSRAKIDNYGKLKQAMIDAFNLVNYNGNAFRNARITKEYFTARMRELELTCVLQEIRQRDIEEQRRIKEQIREEEKARRDIDKALRDVAKEEELLTKAMEKVRAQMAKANEDQRATYEAQIAELEQKWQAAEERNQRALSMAQQTKSGHVYIISNIGSFGEDVYKIGMTRRLEPADRVQELSSASVPFAFDVHAMIWSSDAPGLEDQLHKRFAFAQVNKVNYRKEFFRAPLQEIRAEIEKDNLEIKWTMTAEAREYRESLAIEEAIKGDSAAQQDWLDKQITSTHRSPQQIAAAYDDEELEEESA